MTTLPESILSYIASWPEGHVLSPKELLHIGTRAAVDQALSRLAKEGLLLRIDRGSYVAPVQDKGQTRPPSSTKVIASLAALTGDLIVPDGQSEAVGFGLEFRERATEGYLTSGRSRTLSIGNMPVTLQHAPPWMLLFGRSAAGAALRILAWKGPSVAPQILGEIQSALSDADWERLVTCRAGLPSWLAVAIGKEMTRKQERRLNTETIKFEQSRMAG